MPTVHSEQLMSWQMQVSLIRKEMAAKRQSLRADPASSDADPFRTGLDAAFDSLSATLTLLAHLWVLADAEVGTVASWMDGE